MLYPIKFAKRVPSQVVAECFGSIFLQNCHLSAWLSVLLRQKMRDLVGHVDASSCVHVKSFYCHEAVTRPQITGKRLGRIPFSILTEG